MTSLPARTGLEWIRQGFALFRQQPGRLAFLLLGYMVFLVLLKLVPVLGQPLALVLLPVFGAAFMQACANIDRGEQVAPELILTGFRKPAFPTLFRLGIVYYLVFAVVAGLMMLLDDGAMEKIASGTLDQREAEALASQVWKPMLAALVVYIPAAMAFTFAVPLILWRGMGTAKALFFSFFAVWRNLRAFLVLGLGWFVLFTLSTQLLGVLMGPKLLAVAAAPIMVLIGLLVQCSFYASFRQLFGAAQEPA